MSGAEGCGFMVISTLAEVGHPRPVSLVKLYLIVPVEVGVAVTLLPVKADKPALEELVAQIKIPFPPVAFNVTELPRHIFVLDGVMFSAFMPELAAMRNSHSSPNAPSVSK